MRLTAPDFSWLDPTQSLWSIRSTPSRGPLGVINAVKRCAGALSSSSTVQLPTQGFTRRFSRIIGTFMQPCGSWARSWAQSEPFRHQRHYAHEVVGQREQQCDAAYLGTPWYRHALAPLRRGGSVIGAWAGACPDRSPCLRRPSWPAAGLSGTVLITAPAPAPWIDLLARTLTFVSACVVAGFLSMKGCGA